MHAIGALLYFDKVEQFALIFRGFLIPLAISALKWHGLHDTFDHVVVTWLVVQWEVALDY